MKIQTHKNPDDSYIAWIEGEDHIIGHGTSEINAIEKMIESRDLLNKYKIGLKMNAKLINIIESLKSGDEVLLSPQDCKEILNFIDYFKKQIG